MSNSSDPATDNRPPLRRRFRLRRQAMRTAVLVVVIYFCAAYLLIPELWRRAARHHPALENVPTLTHTKDGIPGDPLNVALIGTQEQITKGMLAAAWYPADPITLKSSLRIAGDTVLHRSYDEAPVSNLYLWNRKQDLAFEQPIGSDPRRRHHVRFWRSEQLDDQGRPLWMGAATLDTKVGFSHTTGEITHHIGPDVDAERDKVIADLQRAGAISAVDSTDNFQPQREGKNGGGDLYCTDGRLQIGVLRVVAANLPATPEAH